MMLRRVVFPLMLAIVCFGLWISADFKVIAAGVAIFLFGMLAMEEGFKALTGGALEGLLRRCTDRAWKSLGFGVVTTAITQSSSLVSVVTISFLSAGMISLAAGIGIVFGANLGTTTGAWLIAGFGLKVSISQYAMPLLVVGIALVLQRSRSLRGVGYVLAGLGFLFLGIHYMKDGFEAFRSQVDLTHYAMFGWRGLVTYALVGVFATVIMQSSHATLVLTITALASGQISYENALALAVGSNIGTTVTAVMGAFGANIEGKRLALAHSLFNVLTAVIALVFLKRLVLAVSDIAAWIGIANDDYALKLAVFHTLFNVLGVVLMLPLTKVLVRVLEALLKSPVTSEAQPRFLNVATTELPEVSVEAVRKENLHLLSNAFEILAHGIGLHRRELDSNVSLGELVQRRSRPPVIDIDARYERTIKPLFGAIVEFVSRIQGDGEEGWRNDLFALHNCSRQIVEAVKGVKHLNKNMSRHMHSNNELVRTQYDRIRIELGEVLRQVAVVQRRAPDTVTILSYDDMKLRILELDAQIVSAVADGIRRHQISPAIVTSILNDAHYAKEVAMDLIEIMQTLSSVGDAVKREAVNQVVLEARDVQELHAEQPTEARQ